MGTEKMTKTIAHWQQIALALALISLMPTGVSMAMPLLSGSSALGVTLLHTAAAIGAISATTLAFSAALLPSMMKQPTAREARKAAVTAAAAFSVSAFCMVSTSLTNIATKAF